MENKYQMDRLGVIDLPYLFKQGISRPLLFFDKIIIADYFYVIGLLQDTDKSLSPSFSYPWPDYDWEFESNVEKFNAYLGITDEGSFKDNLHNELSNKIQDLKYLIQKNICLPSETKKAIPSFRNRKLLSSERNDLIDKLWLPNSNTATYILISDEDYLETPEIFDKTSVIKFVLRQFPVPKENIPLDEIIDFRSQKESQRKLWALRSWMNKVIKNVDSEEKLEDEFMQLYLDYKKQFELLCKKYRLSKWGIIISVSADFLDNICKLSPGSAIKSLINWEVKKTEFEIEAEKLPGKELAYIKHIESVFQK